MRPSSPCLGGRSGPRAPTCSSPIAGAPRAVPSPASPGSLRVQAFDPRSVLAGRGRPSSPGPKHPPSFTGPRGHTSPGDHCPGIVCCGSWVCFLPHAMELEAGPARDEWRVLMEGERSGNAPSPPRRSLPAQTSWCTRPHPPMRRRWSRRPGILGTCSWHAHRTASR